MTLINLLFLIITATAVTAAPQDPSAYRDPETVPANPNVDYYEIKDPGNIAGDGVFLLLETSVNQENQENAEDNNDVNLNLLLTIIARAEETSPNLMEAFVRKPQEFINKNENESFFDGSLQSLVRDLKSGKRTISIFNVPYALENLEPNH